MLNTFSDYEINSDTAELSFESSVLSAELSSQLSVIPSSSLTNVPKTITLTVQEFDSICRRARFAHRVISRLCESLVLIHSRTQKPLSPHKRLARKLKRLSVAKD